VNFSTICLLDLGKGKQPENTNSKKAAKSIPGVRECFSFSSSGRSVVRSVVLANGRSAAARLDTSVYNRNFDDPQAAFDYAFLRLRERPPQPSYTETVRVVDLFCGCGGLSLGAREACEASNKQFSCVGAVDNDPVPLEVYKRNFPGSKTFAREITELLDGKIGSSITSKEYPFVRDLGHVDILLAGPPCQGFSDLNNHSRRNDPRNILYERVARFVELVRPTHILIENVSTAMLGKEKAVERSLEVIERLGYNFDSGIVDTASIGVPQKRKRHVIVASLVRRISVMKVIEKFRVDRERSVMWAIGDLVNESKDKLFNKPSKQKVENVKRIMYLFDNGLFDLPDSQRPKCHRTGRHSYKSAYGRIKPDEPSQTITGGFGSPGQGRFIHPIEPRTLSPHEAARLQFFPDFFDFSSVKKRTALAAMIGNAAPMKLSYIFGLELLAQ